MILCISDIVNTEVFLLQYMNTLSYLSSDAFSSIPSELVPDLQRMISTNEAFRPTAIEFTGKSLNVGKHFSASFQCRM